MLRAPGDEMSAEPMPATRRAKERRREGSVRAAAGVGERVVDARGAS